MSDVYFKIKMEYVIFRISSLAPYFILAGDIGRLSYYK